MTVARVYPPKNPVIFNLEIQREGRQSDGTKMPTYSYPFTRAELIGLRTAITKALDGAKP